MIHLALKRRRLHAAKEGKIHAVLKARVRNDIPKVPSPIHYQLIYLLLIIDLLMVSEIGEGQRFLAYE